MTIGMHWTDTTIATTLDHWEVNMTAMTSSMVLTTVVMDTTTRTRIIITNSLAAIPTHLVVRQNIFLLHSITNALQKSAKIKTYRETIWWIWPVWCKRLQSGLWLRRLSSRKPWQWHWIWPTQFQTLGWKLQVRCFWNVREVVCYQTMERLSFGMAFFLTLARWRFLASVNRWRVLESHEQKILLAWVRNVIFFNWYQKYVTKARYFSTS